MEDGSLTSPTGMSRFSTQIHEPVSAVMNHAHSNPTPMKSTALLVVLVVLAFAETGCSTIPTTPASIAGDYTTRDVTKNYFAYSRFTLSGDSWLSRYVTDAMPGPEPTKGHLSLDGCLLTLEGSKERTQYIVTQLRGRFLLWSPKDYEEYLRTGRTSSEVLYQAR